MVSEKMKTVIIIIAIVLCLIAIINIGAAGISIFKFLRHREPKEKTLPVKQIVLPRRLNLHSPPNKNIPEIPESKYSTSTFSNMSADASAYSDVSADASTSRSSPIYSPTISSDSSARYSTNYEPSQDISVESFPSFDDW